MEIERRYSILIFVIASMVAIDSSISLYSDFSEENVRVFIRLSAKFAVVLFCLAFGISSFNFFFNSKISSVLLKYRAQLGLMFAVTHFSHLIFLCILQYYFHPVFEMAKTTSLIGGGLAYVFILLMAITTFPTIKNKITQRQWSILHTVGGYWIWFIFFRSYFKNVIQKDQEYFLFSLLVVVMILRLAKLLKHYYSNRSTNLLMT